MKSGGMDGDIGGDEGGEGEGDGGGDGDGGDFMDEETAVLLRLFQEDTVEGVVA